MSDGGAVGKPVRGMKSGTVSVLGDDAERVGSHAPKGERMNFILRVMRSCQRVLVRTGLGRRREMVQFTLYKACFACLGEWIGGARVEKGDQLRQRL